MDREMLFDIIYALAAQDGRETALFGTCRAAAREAYRRSLACDAIPELWFEIPLLGEPWLDFHALTSYEDVAGKQAAFAGHAGAYADALAWFAAQEPFTVRQLALSYDTSAGNVDQPAVQLLVGTHDPSVPLGFLDAAGRPDAKGPFRTFAENKPPEWFTCYIGLFPGRQAAGASGWVRLECIVDDAWQHAYANDAAVLRAHLENVGLAVFDDGMLADIQELARSPFPLELQFNVGPDGLALPALSASVRFQPEDWTKNAKSLLALNRLSSWLQAKGLADERCNLLPQTTVAKSVEHEGESAFLSCFPAFVKLRWREGEPADAKSYLMAQIQQQA